MANNTRELTAQEAADVTAGTTYAEAAASVQAAYASGFQSGRQAHVNPWLMAKASALNQLITLGQEQLQVLAAQLNQEATRTQGSGSQGGS